MITTLALDHDVELVQRLAVDVHVIKRTKQMADDPIDVRGGEIKSVRPLVRCDGTVERVLREQHVLRVACPDRSNVIFDGSIETADEMHIFHGIFLMTSMQSSQMYLRRVSAHSGLSGRPSSPLYLTSKWTTPE
jgi:hypothetical protein